MTIKNYKNFSNQINEKVSDSDNDKKDLDPFDEEDWDEIDGHYSIFKIWVGATTKEIRLLCFPAHIQEIKGYIYIRNDRFKTIYKNKEYRFEDDMIQGYGTGNCYIIDEKNYKLDNILKYVSHYVTSREQSCLSNIKSFKKMLSGEYERDEEDEEIDEFKIREKLRLEKLLLQNLEEFKNGIEVDVKKLIKINSI